MNRFFITTLGCKVNQAESDAISSRLESNGWIKNSSPLDTNDDVALCIINTCTVTGKASMQSRQAVRRAIRNFPKATIVVTGCYAQTQPEALSQIPGIHHILGHGDKFELPEIIMQKSFARNDHGPFRSMGRHCRLHAMADGDKTRAVLKIQDGCNAGCTYCIVPKARGKSISMPRKEVLRALLSLKNAGYREVVLSGIHLGSYGLDLAPKTTLTDLLFQIEQEVDIERIRLSSIEPREITDNIIQLVAASDKFCHHFHIPLQSGDSTILKKMARPYDREFFYRLVMKINEQIPDAALGSDVLLGFPGETDELFENTYSFVASLPFAYLHVFPYSPREKTAAAGFDGKLPAGIVKERCRRMRVLGRSLKKKFYEKLVGRSVRVLIENGPLPGTGHYKGRTDNYVPVFLKAPVAIKNTLVNAWITERYGDEGVVGVPLTT